MTSAVSGGRGSPQNRLTERGCVNSVRDGGSKNPKFLRASYMEAPLGNHTMVATYLLSVAKSNIPWEEFSQT